MRRAPGPFRLGRVMTSKALRRRKASASPANTPRGESSSGGVSVERVGALTPVAATKGRLRKCGPIVLISLRITL